MRKNQVKLLILLLIFVFLLNFVGCRKHEHKFIHYEKVDSTCTNFGYEDYDECEICGYSTYKMIPEKDHVAGEWIVDKDSTCSEKGKRHKECIMCEKVMEEDTISYIEHDLVNYEKKDSTCSELGYEAYEACKNCSYTTRVDIPLKEHTKGEWKTGKTSTCSEAGYVYIECIVCDEVIEKKALDTLDHKYNNDGFCSECGETILIIEFNENRQAWVVKGIKDYSVEKIIVPSIYKDYPVVKIEIGAFSECTNLKSLTIPFVGEASYETIKTYFGHIFGSINYEDNSIYVPETLEEVIVTEGTKIGYYAFNNCKYIKSIKLPDTIETLSDFAFSGCVSLEEINVPSSLVSVGKYCFNNCSITTFSIPEGTKVIETSTFYNCTNLKHVDIPNSVEIIDSSAFYFCTSLENIRIPSNLVSIGINAFAYCILFTDIYIPTSVVSIGFGAFSYCYRLKEIKVSAANKNYVSINGDLYNVDQSELLQYALGKDQSEFTVPSSVIKIANYAFANSVNLTKVSIPNTVTSIGVLAFNACHHLKEINVALNNKYYMSVDGNLYNKAQTVLIQYATGKEEAVFEIPSGVTEIADNAFYNATYLKEVIFADTVTTIGNEAFAFCLSLESVKFSNSLKLIGRRAFYGCTKLLSIVIPKSVSDIRQNAFGECSNLKKVVFENSEGWSYKSGINTINVDYNQLANPETAAELLTITYARYNWECK